MFTTCLRKVGGSIMLAVPPAILDLLNFSYKDRFFGKDILHMTSAEERAFIGTYQKLGYIRDNRLVILEPRKDVEFYSFDRITGNMTKTAPDMEMKDQAISYYEGESYLFSKRANLRNRYGTAANSNTALPDGRS